MYVWLTVYKYGINSYIHVPCMYILVGSTSLTLSASTPAPVILFYYLLYTCATRGWRVQHSRTAAGFWRHWCGRHSAGGTTPHPLPHGWSTRCPLRSMRLASMLRQPRLAFPSPPLVLRTYLLVKRWKRL